MGINEELVSKIVPSPGPSLVFEPSPAFSKGTATEFTILGLIESPGELIEGSESIESINSNISDTDEDNGDCGVLNTNPDSEPEGDLIGVLAGSLGDKCPSGVIGGV